LKILTNTLQYRQDPVLFIGTIRSNLDIFGECSDHDLYQALKRVKLDGVTLDAEVSEGATNWSVGQRQLIALARALLRRSKIIILDESTASVDVATETLIQETINEEFQHSTVITIAHRLKTVIKYDRVLVMDDGKVAELDTPLNLMDKPESPDSLFRRMCKESGDWDFLKLQAAQKSLPTENT
jgi:ABC-type multidrug transport system fused ATPase/permease subunit